MNIYMCMNTYTAAVPAGPDARGGRAVHAGYHPGAASLALKGLAFRCFHSAVGIWG